MIRLIVAVDSMNGIANNSGIPWDIPMDKKYFRNKIANNNILMGRGVYEELKAPINSGKNYVLTHRERLSDGFSAISNIEDILNSSADLWVIGGAEVYKQSMDVCDEIYLTRINQDFHCTKFFPKLNHDFKLYSDSGELKENNLTFKFLVYKRTT
ncbi:MAG: dihydrofolate reductase [bacterium]